MHILFITTHNFATNPRLVKEIDLALINNYKVTVVCFDFDNWSRPLNNTIKTNFKNKGVNVVEIFAGRKPFLPWFASTVVNMISKVLHKLNPSSLTIVANTFSKRSWLLTKVLKSLQGNFDLVVAHNPGSFYPAFNYSKQKNIPFGIDIEDYHPGEAANAANIDMLKKLQSGILPEADYCSAASPLIAEYCKNDLGDRSIKKEIIIYNLFSAAEFVGPASINDTKIKLVWFSQNIAAKRGLEEIVPVVKKLHDKVELHLYGNADQQFANEWLQGSDNIYIHQPLLQADLHKNLRLFDIGLAIEPGKDLNNKLALSNKIFAYIQAGLFVLASPTDAQKRLLEDMPDAGVISSLDKDTLEQTFLDCYKKIDLIRNQKSNRYQQANSFSWETEGGKLLSVWKQFNK